MCDILNAPENNPVTKAHEFLAELKNLQKEIQKVRHRELSDKVDSFVRGAQEVSGVKIIARKLEDATADDLRKVVDLLMKAAGEAAIILGTSQDGRVTIITAISPTLVKRGLHAGNISKDVAKIVGGGGGGRPDMAQAGGQYVAKLDEAIRFAAELLAKKLSHEGG